METFDPDALLAERREAVRQTIRRTDATDVHRFLDELFDNRQSHPWCKPFHEFVDGHPHDTFLRAEPEPGLTVIYHPGSRAGMWCKLGSTLEGVGRLHGRGLESMNQIAGEFAAS
jgi:hypothetical protein